MAKLLFLVALLVAATVMAEANNVAPAPAPVTSPHKQNHLLSIKLILHNAAHRPVTFQLVSPVLSKPVEALKNKWTAIPPTLINSKRTNLHVTVSAANSKHVTVKKNLTINLLKHFKTSQLKGAKYLVLTAVESWGWNSKHLLITMGEVVVLSIKI